MPGTEAQLVTCQASILPTVLSLWPFNCPPFGNETKTQGRRHSVLVRAFHMSNPGTLGGPQSPPGVIADCRASPEHRQIWPKIKSNAQKKNTEKGTFRARWCWDRAVPPPAPDVSHPGACKRGPQRLCWSLCLRPYFRGALCWSVLSGLVWARPSSAAHSCAIQVRVREGPQLLRQSHIGKISFPVLCEHSARPTRTP